MKIYTIFSAFFASLVSMSQVLSQTTTPMPESVEGRLQQACSQDVVSFIDAICHDKGTVNTVAINMPGICLQYKYTDKIKEKLQECGGQNVFFEMWKFKFNIENNFKEKLVDYVDTVRKNEINSNSSPILSSYEAFRLSVWACGLNENCHKELFNLFSDDTKLALEQTPYFCDYSSSITNFDDGPYKHMFFKDNYPNGVAQPMCKSYYCKYKECSQEDEKSELFILSDIFRQQYDLLYKAIQP
ncbi:hypothetical protein ABUK73_18225 [Agrobacterium sp. BA1120]|uniref:hypothetical protein n=1 Tax=Agrobacterium sp. BA1120 TaxID=3228927 RepID=UPI00336A6B78